MFIDRILQDKIGYYGLAILLPVTTTSKYRSQLNIGDNRGSDSVNENIGFGNETHQVVTNNFSIDIDDSHLNAALNTLPAVFSRVDNRKAARGQISMCVSQSRIALRKAFIAAAVCFIAASGLSAQAQRQSLQTKAAAQPDTAVIKKLTTETLRLELSLPVRNPSQLQILLHQLNDSSSPRYHQFLSVQQFTDQFAPTTADYARVITFARDNGLAVTRTFANRMLINVSGPATSVDRAFHITMQSYKHPTENRSYVAPDVEPTVDAGVPLLSVDGLSTLNMPHPMLKRATRDELVQSYTTGSGPDGQFLGSDMRAAYAPGVALNGSGQTVGLVELGPYNLSDVQAYFSTLGQPLNVPIYNDLLDVDGVCSGTPTTDGCDDGEEVIDIEQAISMAPNLAGLIVYEAYGSGSDALTAFTQAANDDVAKQLSLSFGFGGTPATEPGYEQIFMELTAQGQNVFVASGDSGANVGGVGYPGNSPNITDSGGTDLTTASPGGAWQSEIAWVGSGGGWNTQSPIPAYQVPVINNSNQGSPSYRNIPDVSMEANTDNYFCANGQCAEGIGGTSLSAPRWAGFLALVNEQANGASISSLNPAVYSLGQQSDYASVFHDITVGNDFNSTSPDLFTAVKGYDLTTGWGTPQGQSLINALAPVASKATNFSLTASPALINLIPGEEGSTTVSLTPVNGFAGTVDLSALVIGAPAGVSATLSKNSLDGHGSVTLRVSTTVATPGGDYLVCVTGASGGISHTAYIKVALPYFTLQVSSPSLYLDQQSSVTDMLTIVPQNGFTGKIAFVSTGDLPAGVTSSFKTTPGAGSVLTLTADSTAVTTPSAGLTISGTSGALTQTVSIALAVSAAVIECGGGVPVNLSSAYNLNAIYSDATTFSTGGLDGGGSAFSATLLSRVRVLNNVRFNLGAANVPDAVYGTGQIIPLPQGQFTTLQLLATGIQGEQAAQSVVVTYTDGTTSKLQQSFSDWFVPSGNANEAEAVAMPYRNTATGTKDDRQFNLYGYTLILRNGKTVKSLTLPNNRNVIVLAATLTSQDLGTPVNLSSVFNAAGIYKDGTMFPSDGGIDTGGAAYSANLLGDESGASSLVVNGAEFNLAAPDLDNVVYATGKPIQLTQGSYTALQLVGTGVQGGDATESVVITYTDGTTTRYAQGFSDWFAPQGYARESVALPMAYRDYFDGTQDMQTFNLYRYTFPVDSGKSIKSVTLGANRYVIVLAATLTKADLNTVPPYNPSVRSCQLPPFPLPRGEATQF